MIGPALRRIRYERGLTQPSLATLCQLKGWDVSRDTLAKIEGQSRWVADFEWVLLACNLGIPVSDLLPNRDMAGMAKKFVTNLEQNGK